MGHYYVDTTRNPEPIGLSDHTRLDVILIREKLTGVQNLLGVGT